MKAKLQQNEFWIESGDLGYEVYGPKGFCAVFHELEMAMQAVRDFTQKRFPKQWSKIPPAMARLCGRDQ